MKQLLISLFLICCSFASATGVYNVRDFGAKGDGKTLDSPAINAGCTILAADPKKFPSLRGTEGGLYDPSESFGGFPEYQDGGHTYFHNSLIWAEGQTNVSITGHGMIDGKGLTKKDTESGGHFGIIMTGCDLSTIDNVTIDTNQFDNHELR